MPLPLSVLLAIGVLALGPLLAPRGAMWPQGIRILDGFVLSVIAGLVVTEIIPTMLHDGRIVLPALALAGFLAPTAGERLFRASAGHAHRAIIAVALLSLALHSVLDGVALVEAARTPGSLLGLGVILHQVPVGLMVWWVLRDQDARRVWLLIVMLAFFTLVGVALGSTFPTHSTSGFAAGLEAVIGGSLLHVVSHRGTTDDGAPPTADWWESTGMVLGFAFLLLLTIGTGQHHSQPNVEAVHAFGRRLIGLAAASSPALLLSFLAAGLLTVAFPAAPLSWLRGGGALREATRGTLLGLPLPVCSCGVVPLYQSLIRRGAPPTAALAFLVATPELGVDAFLISLPLLGGSFSLLRLGAAFVIALLVGVVVGRQLPAAPLVADGPVRAGGPRIHRLRAALAAGFGELFDHIAPWIIVGLLIAAAITPDFLRSMAITELPAGIDVVLFALLGIPTYVCASAATPLVAVLVAEGVSPGAGLAFLITGPATNLSTIGILSRLHGRATGLRFALAVGSASLALGWLVNLLLRGWRPPHLAELAAQPPSSLELASLAVLCTLALASLWRRGPRRFVSELAAAVSHHRPHRHDAHHAHHAH